MRPSLSRSLAATSLLLLASCALAATRPRFGGTLRIEVSAAPARLDPTEDSDPVVQRIAPLVFDTLVRVDDRGEIQPQLARVWQHGEDYQRWQFWLRLGIKLHDGSGLTLAQVASSLGAANPRWHTSVLGESVVVECETPCPHLAAELARARYSIVVRTEDKRLLGTGPFTLAEWQAGRRAVLRANEDHWSGRPYLDAVQIDMNRPSRDQALDIELGKTEVVEVAAGQSRPSGEQRIVLSAPLELMALVFVLNRQGTQDLRVRQALALSLDRAAILNALLQRQGEVAGGLLPQWISGYAFLFSHAPDLNRSRQLRAEAKLAGPINVAYDSRDALARQIAERLAVNARDAGILLQPFAEGGSRSPNADARLVRFRLESPDAAAALGALAALLDPAEGPRLAVADSPQELYAAEHKLVENFRVVPLLHIPEAHMLGSRVRGWSHGRAGGWPLADVWLEPTTQARTESKP